MKLLDCTIRDGGYYTQWDFPDQVVFHYINSFNHLPVDYLEVGHRSDSLPGYSCIYFYCPFAMLQMPKNKNKMIDKIIDFNQQHTHELLYKLMQANRKLWEEKMKIVKFFKAI